MIRQNATTRSLCIRVKVQQKTQQEGTGVTLKRTDNLNIIRNDVSVQKDSCECSRIALEAALATALGGSTNVAVQAFGLAH